MSGINASSIIYVGVAPVLWLLYAVVVLRESTWRHALGTGLRIGILTLGACLWWIAGLEVEAAYGVNVLKFTETVPSTSATSNPADIFRGLGYWYFYGSDHTGPWTNAAVRYTQDIALLATSYAVPVLALVAAAFVRWRERAYFLLLLFVGLVLSVGPFPFSDPTLIGGQLKAFMTDTTAGLALRSTDRATPLVLLALVMLLGSGLTALWSPRLGRRAWSPPCWWRGSSWPTTPRSSSATPSPTTSPSPPRCPPTSWRRSTTSTRPTPAPGSSPSRATTSPPTAGVTPSTRPSPRCSTGTSSTREQQIMGSIATADTLYATDGPLQEGTANMNALAPMARLMGAGDLMVEYDQQYERYGVPQPQLLALQLQQTPLGLTDPLSFGSPRPNVSIVSTLNEQDLSEPGNLGWPSPIVTYTVPDPRPLLRGESDTGAVVMEGDATGLNNLAGLGPAEHRQRRSTTPARWPPTRPGCATLAVAGRPARAHRHQPQAGVPLGHAHGQRRLHRDAGREPGQDRPERQPDRAVPGYDASPARRTRPTSARSTSPPAATATPSPTRPRTRPTAPSTTTSTRPGSPAPSCPTRPASGGRPSSRQPVTTDHITLVQPQRGDRARWVSAVTLTFDGKDPVRERLTRRLAPHQRARPLTFPSRTFHTLRVTIDGTTDDTAPPALGLRRRLLRGRDPGPAGAPGRPDADADALDARQAPPPPTASPS